MKLKGANLLRYKEKRREKDAEKIIKKSENNKEEVKKYIYHIGSSAGIIVTHATLRNYFPINLTPLKQQQHQ